MERFPKSCDDTAVARGPDRWWCRRAGQMRSRMQSICVPVHVKAGVNLEEIIEEREESLDDLTPGNSGMLELRCDVATPRLMMEAIEFAHLPVIITVRP